MPGTLERIRVLDLTRALAGPYCAKMLGDMGADVIKIELPGKGDDSRGWGPPFQEGESSYFLSINRNKRSLTLNLRDEKGKEVLRKLIKTADVLIENFTPGVMERLGFGYEQMAEINPALIYCAMSGFGPTGPYAQKPAYDLILQGMGGVMSVTGPYGGPPTKCGVAIADITTGMFGAFAIVNALFHRERTGEGQRIDTSLLHSQIALLTFHAGQYFATGHPPMPIGNLHPSITPYQTIAVQDGYVNVAPANESLWRRFCEALNLDELPRDPRFEVNAKRLANRDELTRLIEARTTQLTQKDVIDRLEAAGVPCGPVYRLDQIFSDPQVQHLGLQAKVQHPKIGELSQTGIPYTFTKTPGEIRRHPPLLGEHNDELLAELGYSADEIQSLRGSQVI
ncbi:MAG: CoA transferase [Chloroflexi bacterium]|nr:CoA transferase [Chloroflexota bacterium]